MSKITNKQKMDWYLGSIRISLTWLEMFFSGQYNTKESWNAEMERRRQGNG